MNPAPDPRMLDALLGSWDRNNRVLLNLLRAIPEAGPLTWNVWRAR